MPTPLSPLDGRYASAVDALRPFFSEDALNRARLEVEVRYFIALSKETGVPEIAPVSARQEKALLMLVASFDDKAAQEIKVIERTTNHDVKAVEYYLKRRIESIPGLKKYTEFVHFGLTSEDVNNLAYGMLIMRSLQEVLLPAWSEIATDLLKLAKETASVRLLSLTHGQPATPTTMGKELMVFVERFSGQWDQLQAFSMHGKFGGAVGNFSAHIAAYPSVQWEDFAERFVKSLGFSSRLNYTTQINPHDDLAELSHIIARMNTIGINFCRDAWMYISRGVFRQKVSEKEVGSSAMPHKVNPIDFENAEGNFGLSSALFHHFAEKLPISRLQRDLSDSTVQRNIGVAFGYHLLALRSLRKGLGKISLDADCVAQELALHPEVIAEAIQTILRKHGVTGAYEKLKKLTRGEKVTKEMLSTYIDALDIPQSERERLKKMM